jgi:undecaprenyl-diphosphatase
MVLLNIFWSQLWQTLNHWDQELFLKINTEWANSFLDNAFPWYRDSNTWIPLYLFLFLFVVFNFGWKIWPWVFFFIITITLTDQISSKLIKAWIDRPRPCRDAAIVDHVRLLLNYCPGNGSFTSSHATNHFGMACFIFFTMRSYFKNWSYLFLLWAATISYGQVYVGIHYPLDIIGGAVLGSLLGLLTASAFNRFVGLPPLLKNEKIITAS